jgi:hypothetical protein
MKKFKRLIKLAGFILLLLLAAVGAGFLGLAPRRPQQDYDNEIKTEIVEAKEDQVQTSDRN